MKTGRVIVSLFFVAMAGNFLFSECKAHTEKVDNYRLSHSEGRVRCIKQETGETLSKITPHIHLRSSFGNLSPSQVHSMPNVFIRKKDEWGFYGHSTVRHHYAEKSVNGDCVVIDAATGLMWHQSGSGDYMSWNSAKEWIKKLNNKGYAGYQDWRLPTLEEAASLLEQGKTNNLYIAPVFDEIQWGIWSGDMHGSEGAWSVYFSLGNVRWNVKNRFVRPVRSIK